MRSRKTKIILTALLFVVVLLFCILLFRKWEFGLVLLVTFYGTFFVVAAVVLGILWFTRPIIYNIAASLSILVVSIFCCIVIFDDEVAYAIRDWSNWKATRDFEKEAQGIGVFPKGRETRLAEAIVKNDLATVKELLQRGLDVNARGDNGENFLTFALSQKVRQADYVVSSELVRALLDHGVEANPKSKYGIGNTIEYWRNFNPHDPLVLEALLKGGAEIPESWYKGSEADLRLYVQYGAKINDRIDVGYNLNDFSNNTESAESKWVTAEWTPVMMATDEELWDQALTLVALGADLTYADQHGITLKKVIAKQLFVYDESEQLQELARKVRQAK